MTLPLVNAGREALNKLRRQEIDEDYAMKLFSRYTILILAFFSIIITPRQFLFSSPIKCWSNLPGAKSNYVDRMCLINGTYVLPHNEFVVSYQPEKQDYIHWYAVTPLLFIFQTLPIAIPLLFWSTTNPNSGIEVSKAITSARILQAASNYRNTGIRRDEVKYIVENINRVDMQKKNYPKLTRGQRAKCTACCGCSSTYSSYYLANLILAVKVLYILALPLNIAFISAFLGKGYVTMGFQLLHKFSLHKSIFFEEIFPLRTVCKTYAYVNTIRQPQVVQCLLTMNMYNEKLFLFLWFWYFFLFLVAVIDFIENLVFRCSSSYRMRFFRPNLPLMKNRFDGKSLKNFFHHFCSLDCCFALKLMNRHLDQVTMKLILEGLITQYKAEEGKMRINEGFDDNDDDIEKSTDVDADIDKQTMRAVANMEEDY